MPYSFVPKDVMAHVDWIMDKKGRKKRADAFRDLADYARRGIELEAIGSFRMAPLKLPVLKVRGVRRGRK